MILSSRAESSARFMASTTFRDSWGVMTEENAAALHFVGLPLGPHCLYRGEGCARIFP